MRTIIHATAAGIAVGAFALAGNVANAQDNSSTSTTTPTTTVAPAPAAMSTFTLPLLLSSLTVDVTTDAGGGLLDVSLSGGAAASLDPVQVKPNRVSFVNENGSVNVKVSAKHGGERVTVRAGALADILGQGGWSGDVFDTGETSSVGFVVADAGDGSPNLTDITVSSPAQYQIGEVKLSSDDDDDDSERSASVSIEFSQAGQTRTLRIKAEVETDDGETNAHLKISLGRVKGRQLASGAAVGDHTWNGMLCDGTPAAIGYTVGEDGRITITSTSPEADARSDGREASIRFSDKERVRVNVTGDDGELTVSTAEKIRCGRNTPTVNGQPVTTTSIPDDDEDDDGDHRDGDEGDHGDGDHGEGDHGEGDHGDGDHGDDGHGDDSSTTEAPTTTVDDED
jgi:hypothetical protein